MTRFSHAIRRARAFFQRQDTAAKFARWIVPSGLLCLTLFLWPGLDLGGQAPSLKLPAGALAEEPPAPDDSTLSIVQATPTGSLSVGDLRKEIVVVFNQAMIPLGVLPEKVEPVFQITPRPAGKFRWYGSRVVAFVPGEPLRPGTRYSVTVPAGLKALNGMRLAAAHKFRFATPPLKLLSSSPRKGARTDYRPTFRLYFNYPVRLEDIRAGLKLYDGRAVPFLAEYPKKPKRSGAGADHPDAGRERRRKIIIKPRRDLARDARVTIAIPAGLKPEGGTNGLPAAVTLRFQTYGPLRATLKQEAKFFQNLYGLRLEFNNPVKLQDLKKHARLSPPAKFRRGGNYNTGRISVGAWQVEPLRDYTLSLGNGLTDAYGNQLTGTREFRFRTPRYRREFRAMQGVDVLEAKMRQRVPVTLAGMSELKGRVAPLSLEQIQAYVQKGNRKAAIGSGARPVLWKSGITAGKRERLGFDLAPYLKQDRWLTLQWSDRVEDWRGKERQQTATQFVQSTDLGMVVKKGAHGSHVYVHSFSSGRPRTGVTIDGYRATTKLGGCLTDKTGHCTFKHGYAGSNANFYTAALGKNKTGDRAFVTQRDHSVYMWGLAGSFDRDASRSRVSGQIVFDRKLYRPGDRMHIKAFLAVRQGSRLRTDTGALGPVQVKINSPRGRAVFQKQLGATSQGGVQLDWTVPKDAPLGHYTVHMTATAVGKTSWRARVSDTFQIEEFRPVAFTVSTKGPRDGRVGVTQNVKIKGEYLFGAPMNGSRVAYSLRRRPRSESYRSFPGFYFGDDDYGMSWTGRGWKHMSGGSGKLDRSGEYDLALKPEPLAAKEPGGQRDEDLNRPYDLQLEARVTDRDDKTVAARTVAVIRPGPVAPGIRSRRSFQSYTRPFNFDLVAVDANGRGAAAGPATIVIHQKEWKSIQTKGPGGSVQRKNTLIRKELLRKNVTVGGRPIKFEYKAPKSGSYTIMVRKADGAYARRSFYATGSGFIGWNFSSDDRVRIMPERTDYKPGETARLLIQSPYKSARAIISVERENVIWQKTYEIKGNAEPLSVPIRAAFIPDVYVSVILLRPREIEAPREAGAAKRFRAEDLGRPRFAIGMVRLSVSAESKRLPLTMKTDRKSYGPGDPVTIDIRTEPGAEIALSVADRAVLDLLNYSYADPLGKFYKNWPLGVQTIENRRALIRQLSYTGKGDAPGGKGLAMARKGRGGFDGEQEDGTRRNFKHTAFWKGDIVADGQGRARINFTLPDNLTTFRVMALASHKARYNRARTEFKVSRPLVVRPVVPRFMRPGDKIELGALLTNQTGKDATFRVKLAGNLLELKGDSTQKIELGAGESGEVRFPVEVDGKAYRQLRAAGLKRANDAAEKEKSTERPGGPAFAMAGGLLSASTGGVKDAVRFKFPLREHPPVETATIAGFTDDSSEEGIVLPKDDQVQDRLGRLRVSFASTALVGLDRAFGFYRVNPYFCLEQRASAFMLGMTARPLLRSFALKPAEPGGYDFNRISELFLKEAGAFQNSDGGFRSWRDHPGLSRAYLTAYIVFAMQAAAEANEAAAAVRGGASYAIPAAVKRKAVGYLKNVIRKPPRMGRGYLLETLAMVQLVLVREGIDDSSTRALEAFLLQHGEKLSLRGKGNLMLSIARRRGLKDFRGDQDLTALMKNVRSRMEVNTRRVTFKEASSGSYLRAYYARGATMGVLLRAFVALDPKHPFIPLMVRHSLADSRRGFWYDSHGSGQLAYALGRYRDVFEKEPPGFTALATLAGQRLAKSEFRGRSTKVFARNLALARLLKMADAGKTHPLRFQREGRGRLYYSASLSYSPAPRLAKPREEGIEIRREIRSLSGPDAGEIEGARLRSDFPELRRGGMYLYRLIVTNPKPVYDVMIRDNLPANIEVVREGFATESNAFASFLRDKRNNSLWHRPRYEYRDDAVLISQEWLTPGVHEYFYLARALVRGQAGAPAARAFAMYEPEIFGTSAAGIQEVR